jgi:hypothetical protein
MNLSQLQAAIQAHGHDASTDAEQLQFLNDTYREVHSKGRWEFLEAQDSSMSTVVGTNIYAWPMTNFRNVDAVRLTSTDTDQNTNLEYMAKQDFRDKENIDLERSTPEYWTQIAGELHLWPYPDSVYTVVIDYIIEPPDLVNPSDIPIIPTAYHDVLVWGALRSMAYRDRDVYSFMNSSGQYESRLLRMQDEYRVMQRQTSSHVRKSGFYDSGYPWMYPSWRTG